MLLTFNITIIHSYIFILIENIETADYIQEGDVGFKKPKVNISPSWNTYFLLSLQAKKKRSSRRAPVESEPLDDVMDVDQPIVPLVRDLDANFVDDDELQAALARSRQAKLRKTKKLSPEDLAKKSEYSACPGVPSG